MNGITLQGMVYSTGLVHYGTMLWK